MSRYIRLCLTGILLLAVWYCTDGIIWMLNQPNNILVVAGMVSVFIVAILLGVSLHYVWDHMFKEKK